MKTRFKHIVPIGMLAIVSAVAWGLRLRERENRELEESAAALKGLDANLQTSRDQVRAALLEKASQSSAARAEVVHAVVVALNSGETGSTKWFETVRLAGDIGAIEAVPALVKQLRLSFPPMASNLSPSHVAILKMGEPAVGPLSELMRSWEPSVRYDSVEVLALIGGKSAKNVLTKALEAESDNSTRDSIVFYLNHWRLSPQ